MLYVHQITTLDANTLSVNWLDEQGKKGWELVSVVPDGNRRLYFWKRPA